MYFYLSSVCIVRILRIVSGTCPETPATETRFSSCDASILFCMNLVKRKTTGRITMSSSARPMFLTAITAKIDMTRQASANILTTPDVNSASTVSTSPMNREATATR